jgi:hypothetical protein
MHFLHLLLRRPRPLTPQPHQVRHRRHWHPWEDPKLRGGGRPRQRSPTGPAWGTPPDPTPPRTPSQRRAVARGPPTGNGSSPGGEEGRVQGHNGQTSEERADGRQPERRPIRVPHHETHRSKQGAGRRAHRVRGGGDHHFRVCALFAGTNFFLLDFPTSAERTHVAVGDRPVGAHGGPRP